MIQQFVSTQVSLPQPVPETAPAMPELRQATFDDYAQIARLETANGLYSQPYESWKSIWTNSPIWWANRGNWALGWVLEDENRRIVGSLMSVPSAYVFRGETIRCSSGRAWVVAPAYRGYSLWLMDEYLTQPQVGLFMATTVGPLALEAWSEFGHRIPLGDWQGIAYWVTSHRGFVHRALQSKRVPMAGLLSHGGGAILKARDFCRRALPHAPGGVTIEETERFDARFDAFWSELVRQNPNKLLALRDRAALEWHFALPMRRDGLWIFTASRGGLLRGYCIIKWQEQSNGMRRMRLVDFQSVDQRDDLLPGLLRAALQKCIAEKIDLLEHHGLGIPKMRAFDTHAPYRRRLGNWPYFYRASDPEIDESLRSPEPWDPSAFDGDASLE